MVTRECSFVFYVLAFGSYGSVFIVEWVFTVWTSGGVPHAEQNVVFAGYRDNLTSFCEPTMEFMLFD